MTTGPMFGPITNSGIPPAGESPAWPASVSANQLCAHPPITPPALFRDLLYQSGTAMLSGPSKARKTYTLLGAAVSLTCGLPWLGFRTQPCPVIYLNLEVKDFVIARRLQEITKALAVSPPTTLHLLNLRGHLVTVEQLEERLGQIVQDTGAGLVVLDPYYKVSSASGVEENSNDSQALLLYHLEALCSRHNAALIMAHHFAKGDASMKRAIDRAAGGGALARSPDVVMTLTDHQEVDCMVVEFALRDFITPPPFVVRWSHPVWVVDADLSPTDFRKPGRIDTHPSEEALRQLGGDALKLADWAARLTWSESTLRRKAKALVSAGQVKEVGGVFSKT